MKGGEGGDEGRGRGVKTIFLTCFMCLSDDALT